MKQILSLILKNKWIGIFLVFLILFGVYQLSIGTYSSSDFTHTNTQLSGANIQLKHDNIVISNPVGSSYGLSGYVFGVDTTANTYLSSTVTSFCSNFYGSAYVTHVLSAADISDSTNYYEYRGYWATPSGGPRCKRLTSITCVDNTKYKFSGNIQQTNVITTTERYNHFELDYNETLNGGTIAPYLLIGLDKVYFEDGVINTDEDVMSDTQLKVGFDFTSSGSATPQLANNIVLSASYIEAESESLSISSNSNTQNLNVLASLKSGVTNTLSKENPFRFVSDIFYNIGYMIENFLKRIF